MKRLILAALALSVAGCGGGQHDDLVRFVQDAGQGMRGKVDPLPEVKPYEPFHYDAFDLPDPFKPRKLKSAAGGGGGLQPDRNRRKEPLEAYELEKLKMAGTLQQNKATYALIKAPDNTLYRVKIGNYMGVNYGIVTDITELEVKLSEIVEDSAGEWTERTNSLTLVEDATQGKSKK
jgi:type IV pilus assembly protein PilP